MPFDPLRHPTSQAINDLGRGIRTSRILKPGHDVSEMKVTANQMSVEWILEERARELCGEWLR